MSAQRFSTGKQLIWGNVTYRVKRLLPGRVVRLENIQTAEVREIPFTELAQALFARELTFMDLDQPALQEKVGQAATLADYPQRLRELAEYRFEVIRPLLTLGPEPRTRQAVAQRVAEIKQAQQAGQYAGKQVSVASVYRWIGDYVGSGNDIRALAGSSQRQGDKQEVRLEEAVETIIRSVMTDRYYIRERVTTDDIYLEILLRIDEENRTRYQSEKLTPPSRTTIWRRIEALDEAEKLTAKRGRRVARQQLAQHGQMNYPQLPLERVEIDHTRLDLIVVDEQDNLPLGRPTLTYCLDTATRYPLGFYIGFDPPSYLTVMQCLHHAILTKGNVREKYGTHHDWLACGIPFTLAVDNGKEFTGVDLQDACLSLGIELMQMPVQMPQFKAAVERMFETLNVGLLHTLPGTTFSTVKQRGDYKSEQEACITLQQLDQVFHLFLLDVYAESFHRGLSDIPARRWEAMTQTGFFPRLPASAAELKILLGRVVYRHLLPSGIQFLNLRYNSADLAPLRTRLKDEKVKIKYDPADLGCLYVFDPQSQAYLMVACLDQEYAQGLSLWKHRLIQNVARRESEQVDVLALARAKRTIQEIVQASRTSKKVNSRVRVARWGKGDRPSLPDQKRDLPLLPQPSTHSVEPSLDWLVDLDDLEREGWRAGYDLPIDQL